ncbi:MAG TPA: hypothetical protein VM511_00460, partial [Luteolibacter sp.]|nr:hypothetical protein [Luteolibacter sp.]
MKPYVPLSLKCLIIAALGSGFASADIIWDANGTTVASPNPFDGAGTWLDTDKWWDTTLNAGAGGNFTWSNVTNGASSVQLGNGGLAGAINLTGGVTVGGIQFNAVVMPAGPTPGPAGTEEAYSFTGGTLTLGNNAILDLRTNSSTSNTNAGRIRFQASSVLAGSNASITNANGGNVSLGLIQFSGSNTWNGNISMTGNGTGGLFIEALNAAAFNTASKITINNNASFVVNYASGTNNVAIDVGGTGAASRGAIRFDTTQTLGGNILLTSAARITTNTSAGIVGTLSGNISGAFGLNLNSNILSAGTILFKGSNTYTTLTVNRGNAQIGEGGVGTSGTGLTTLNQSTTAGVVAYISGTGQIKNGLTVTAGQVRPGDSSGNGL